MATRRNRRGPAVARAAVRRPPSRNLEPASPAAQLPRRTTSWPRDVAILLALALASLGIVPLLGYKALTIPACILCLIAAVTRSYFGRRAALRADITDRLVEAISPALGCRTPDRRTVKLSAWSHGFPGEPAKVTLRYAPGLADDDPAWRSELVKTVGRRLLADYQVDKHDRRRLRLDLVLTKQSDETSTPATQARAERTVTELLGATASITNVEWKETELVALDVKHEAGVKLASQAYRTRIERVVSTMLPGRWRAKWDLLGDKVRFEQRPPLPGKVDHPAPQLDKEHLHKIPLAVGEDGELVRWNLKGAAPHMIVVGKTGQGKTVVINGVVMEFCARGWPVRICDPKRIEFMGLRGWANVQCVATTVEHQVALIYQTWLEMERRYALIESGECTEDDFEPMLLVLDEYRDFVGMASSWYANIKVSGMPNKCPAFEWVASLARKGRSARIHLLLGTQRPDAEFLGGEMRDNFATRMSLGRLSPQGAMMMWEAAYIGVSVPRGKPGRGTAVDDNDNPVEVQAYWTPDPRRLKPDDVEDRAILERLRPTECLHPPLEVELAEDLFDDLDDTGKPPTPAQLEKRMRQAQWESVTDARLVPAAVPPADPLERAPRTPSEILARGPLKTPTPPPAPPSPAPEVEEAVDVDVVEDADDLDGEYGPITTVRASNLRAGDLILVDDTLDIWGVIASEPEPDEGDASLLCIEWRSDDDDGGWLDIPDDSAISTRHPIEQED